MSVRIKMYNIPLPCDTCKHLKVDDNILDCIHYKDIGNLNCKYYEIDLKILHKKGK